MKGCALCSAGRTPVLLIAYYIRASRAIVPRSQMTLPSPVLGGRKAEGCGKAEAGALTLPTASIRNPSTLMLMSQGGGRGRNPADPGSPLQARPWQWDGGGGH